MALLCGWKLEFDCGYLPARADDIKRINYRTMRHATTLISSNKELLEQEIASSKNVPSP